jgi:hypothetical protein
MEIKKMVKEDVLLNCLQVTSNQLFIKSPVDDLIMLWRLPISSTTPFLIKSQPHRNLLGEAGNPQTRRLHPSSIIRLV